MQNTMDLSYLTRLGIALRNCHLMLIDRGFQVPVVPEALELVGQKYAIAMQKKITLSEACACAYAQDSVSVHIWVFDRNFDAVKGRDRMISTDQVKTMNDTIKKYPGNLHIVLSPNKLSPQAKKERCDGQVFLFDDLLINLPKHELVPKHTVISERRLKAVLGQCIKTTDLPYLLRSDPIARWYDFQENDIIAIENAMMPSYRIVKE